MRPAGCWIRWKPHADDDGAPKPVGYGPSSGSRRFCLALANIVAPVPIGKATAPMLERPNAIRPLGVDVARCRGMPTGVTAFARLPEHATTPAIAATVDVDDLGRIGAVLATVRIGIARLAVLLVGIARACDDRRSPASCRSSRLAAALLTAFFLATAAGATSARPPRAPSALPHARARVPSVSAPEQTALWRRRSSPCRRRQVTSRRRPPSALSQRASSAWWRVAPHRAK